MIFYCAIRLDPGGGDRVDGLGRIPVALFSASLVSLVMLGRIQSLTYFGSFASPLLS